MANHVDDFGLVRGGEHRLGLFDVQRERFFAQDVFAVFRGGDGNFRVRIRGRDDVHDVDQRRLDDFAPVGGGVLPAELGARGLHAGGVASAKGMQLDIGPKMEKTGRLPPGIGMCPAHEAVANQSYAQSLGHRN